MPLNPPQDYRKTEFIHRQGLAADRPAAADVLVGTLYFSTDTLSLERSNGTVWTAFSGTGAVPGPPGPTGPAGADGVDGEIGPQGPTGSQGSQGSQGPSGIDGNDGEEGLPGVMGPRGIQGIQGLRGLQGPFGYDGEDGIEGFSIPGARGLSGSQGIQGATGARGFQGPPGFDGEDGIEPMMMMLGASGGGIPALPLQSVQFNDGGKLAGHSGMLYDKSNSTLGVGNFITSGDGYVVGNFATEGLSRAGTDFYEKGRANPLGHANAWTPVWTGLTVGNGTVTARESRVGHVVFFAILLLWGSTTAITAASVSVTLPYTCIAMAATQTFGRIGMIDIDLGQIYFGNNHIISGTEINLRDGANPSSFISATNPFVWTTSDQLYIQGWYVEA